MFFRINKKGRFLKMKNKWFVGIGVFLVMGLVLAGCKTDGNNELNTDPKSIKIIGFNLTGYEKFFVFVSETPQLNWSSKRHFESRTNISGPEITVELAPTFYDESEGKVKVGEPWTGSGKYYLWIQIDEPWVDGKNPAPGRPVYFYAVHGTSSISDGVEVDYSNANGIAPIYIEEAVTILEFSKFVYRGHDSTAG
jgi:hypothetical protein